MRSRGAFGDLGDLSLQAVARTNLHDQFSGLDFHGSTLSDLGGKASDQGSDAPDICQSCRLVRESKP
jgi:hypothetical protein